METKDKVLTAAVEIFAEKGRHGARMEEIAARAGVNKAMVYYFFTSRENLYQEALSYCINGIHKAVMDAIMSQITMISDPVEQMKMILKAEFEAYARNRHFTRVLIEGIATQPEAVHHALEAHAKEEAASESCCGPKSFLRFIDDNIAKGVFRKIDARQLVISILGVNLIYFIAQPMLHVFLDKEVPDDDAFMKERLDSLTDVLLNGILEKRPAQ